LVFYNIYSKNAKMSMFIIDYDEFGIYTTEEEVKNYVESLIISGEKKDSILEKCQSEFGEYLCRFIEYMIYDKN
jgi:F0F1-type ATP synthase delta subunit